MNKHTPGPWSFAASPSSSYWDFVVKIGRGYIGIDTDNAEADGRLIAAAPDLLEALKECLRRIDDGADYGPEHAVSKSRAAIAKAEWLVAP